MPPQAAHVPPAQARLPAVKRRRETQDAVVAAKRAKSGPTSRVTSPEIRPIEAHVVASPFADQPVRPLPFSRRLIAAESIRSEILELRTKQSSPRHELPDVILQTARHE